MEWLVPLIKAFVIGGLICIPAQILLDRSGMTPARILTLYVVAGVILGALGLYSPLMEYAQCGASTPLTGFGYAIAAGTEKAVDKQGLLGALTGSLCAASGGTTAALCAGFIASVLAKSRPRS